MSDLSDPIEAIKQAREVLRNAEWDGSQTEEAKEVDQLLGKMLYERMRDSDE